MQTFIVKTGKRRMRIRIKKCNGSNYYSIINKDTGASLTSKKFEALSTAISWLKEKYGTKLKEE